MGIVAGLAGAAAGASLASTAYNAFSGGSSGGYSSGSTPPASYIPAAQPGADQLYQSIYGQMGTGGQSLPGQVVPGYQQYAQNIENNPYAGYAQNNALNTTGYGLDTVAPQQAQGAQQLYGLGGAGAGYAPQILAQGFDPQTAQYNQQFQQQQDQTNAVLAQNGVAGSPYAAGVENQANQNFNTAWQQNLLQRENAGIQGYGNLVNASGQGISGGAQLGGQALNTMNTVGNLPYQTYGAQQTDSVNALNSLTSGTTNAYGLDQNTLNALSAYLKLGQSATSVGQAGAAQNFGNNQAYGQNISNALAGLGSNSALTGLFNGSSNYGQSSQGADYNLNYNYSPDTPDTYYGSPGLL